MPPNLTDSTASEARPKYNPFRPNSIVVPGMFAGRFDELVSLERVLYQTKYGNPEHFIITGERGIGKSSLLFYLECVADGSITTLNNETLRFLVISLELDDESSYPSIITKIGAGLRREISKREKLKEAAKATWDFLSRWEVLGVKYEGNAERDSLPEQLSRNCATP